MPILGLTLKPTAPIHSVAAVSTPVHRPAIRRTVATKHPITPAPLAPLIYIKVA